MTRASSPRVMVVRTLRVRSVALQALAAIIILMLVLATGVLGISSLHAEPPSPARIKGKNGHVFIAVPAGSYEVGAKGNERNPLRTVTLKSYAIAETETTNAQFAAFVEATGYVTDAEKRGSGKVAVEGMPDWAWEQIPGAHWRRPFGDKGKSWDELKNHPVTQISGADAEAYCKWLGARLPMLTEWEVAARAGKTTRYPWGNKYEMKLANTWNGESHLKDTREDGHLYTAPVKSFPPNAWGLYDVIGNVFEYCTGLPMGARQGEEKRLVAGRGGSWWCSPNTCSFFNLVDIGQMDRHGSLANQGFRVVVEVKE